MSLDLIGPLLNFASTAAVAMLAAVIGWSAKRSEWKRDILRQRVAMRQRVYVEFLAETDRLVLKSFDGKVSLAAEFHQMAVHLSEIELLSSDSVKEAAKDIWNDVLNSHTSDKKHTFDYGKLKATFVATARREIAKYEK